MKKRRKTIHLSREAATLLLLLKISWDMSQSEVVERLLWSANPHIPPSDYIAKEESTKDDG